MHTYDVIVVGAGAAGLCAAIQVGRAGGSCLLVEKSGMVGGTTTLGGVNFPGLFHAWGHHIIAGIGWELVTRSVEEVGGTLPDFRDDCRPHHHRQVTVDRFSYAALADAMLQEAHVRVLFHSMPTTAVWRQTSMWEVQIACKEGIQTAAAQILIDTTGDANLVSVAGLDVRRNPELQPATLVFRAEGYDAAQLECPAMIEAARAAIRNGSVLATDFGGKPELIQSLLRHHGGNILHIPGVDGRTSGGKSDAETKGRASLLRLQRFFRQQPGLSNFHITYFAPECGIRETVTIAGEVEVQSQDYISGHLWSDAICYSFYPIDIHVDSGHGIDTRPLPRGTYPTIPLRALLPRASRNFLAAGRIACGDKEAASAFRVQATCMAMGQAAGATAWLAALRRIDPRKVPIEDILGLLSAHGAIVPVFNRFNQKNADLVLSENFT